MHDAAIAGLVAGAYLLGSIPVGFIVAKAVKGIDIREAGSGNIGATNAGRVLGLRWGVLVWLTDALKGFIAPFAAGTLSGHAWLSYSLPIAPVLCAIAAICGHNFSIFLSFRGGKGVSTSFGAFVYLFPLGLLIAAGVWVVTVLTTRYVSMGSMLGGIALAVAALLLPKSPFGDSLCLTIVCLAVALLIILRHKSNIRRLLNGTENKIGPPRPQ